MRIDHAARLRIRLSLIGVLFLQFLPCFGRPGWVARSFKPKDGLGHQVVRDIARAPGGEFWIATWGGGISRFDGSRWDTINAEQVLSDFMIRCLAFDQEGGLWAGTPEGVRHFDGRRWTLFTSENTPVLRQDSVFVILPRANGEIWIGMLDGYLYSYDPRKAEGSRWELIKSPDFFDNGAIRSLLELDDGSIWVGGEHLYHLSEDRWTRYPMNQVSFSICRTDEGELYAAETDGLYRFDGRSWNLVPEGGSAPRSLGIASDGSLLVGTQTGLRIRQNGVWADFVFDTEEPVPYVEVIRSFPNDSTWIGTRAGALLIQKSDWTPVAPPILDAPILQGQFITAPDLDPTVLVPDGRIFRWEKEHWREESNLGSAGGAVVSVLRIQDGKFVLRREQSIVEYDTATLAENPAIIVSDPEAWSTMTLSGTRAWDPIALAADGTYWWNRTDEEKLYRLQNGNWVLDNGGFEPGASIDSFKETRDGRIWVFSQNRVAVDGRHMPEFDVIASPGHRGHRITDICTTRDGAVWISTSGSGIFALENGKVVQWHARTGLPSNWVRCLLEASDGTVWAGMEDSSIASFKEGRWVSFTRKDFQLEGSVAQIEEGPGGRIWFLLEPGGLLSYTPSSGPPDTIIDLYPDSLIPGGNALFAFHGWDASQMTLREELVYSWRVVRAGSDTEVTPWTPYSPATTVGTPPLEPGRYEFQVRAADKERNADPSPAVLEFSVEPYLYMKPGFWLAVFPSTFLVLFLALRWQEARRNLLQMARIDGLTGTFKRDYFTQLLEAEIQRSRRYGRDLSILLLDLDEFKQVNDTYGHDAGDRVLRKVSERIVGACRTSDSVARWGGEEFILTLPETGLEEARVLAERIRATVQATSVQTERGRVSCTVSIGVARLTEEHRTLDGLLKVADRALYRAKGNGRNRVEADRDLPG